MPPFLDDVHIIAIASTSQHARAILLAASEAPAVSVLLLLRDPRHRPDEVQRMAHDLLACDIPENVRPGLNGTIMAGFDVVHYPLSAAITTAGRPPVGLVGVSVHSTHELHAAKQVSPDYIMASPVFPTTSKPGHPGIGLSGLKAIVAASSVPVYALGGMNSEDAIRQAIRTGARGIGSVSLFLDGTRDALRRRIVHVSEVVNNALRLESSLANGAQ